jgi:hypothetical protein
VISVMTREDLSAQNRWTEIGRIAHSSVKVDKRFI